MNNALIHAVVARRMRLTERYFLSASHWDKIFASTAKRTQGKRYARSCYARGYRQFDLAFNTKSPQALQRARADFQSATVVDAGMCDAYLGLLLVSMLQQSLAAEGVQGFEALSPIDDLGVLAAAATASHRFGQEQNSHGAPIRIVFNPLSFGQSSVDSGEDLKLYYASELFKEGEANLAQQWVERTTMRNAKRYAVQSKIAFMNGHYEETIMLLMPLMSLSSPLRLDALFTKASCLLRLEQPERALEVLEEGLSETQEGERSYLFLRYGLVGVYLQQGDEAEAQLVLDELFRLDPTFLDVAQQLGLNLADASLASPSEKAWQEIVSGLQSS